MPKSKKKRRFTFRFELGLGGLAGLGIIFFCVFLWMFLLGVWAGQTVLLPSGDGGKEQTISRFASNLWGKKNQRFPTEATMLDSYHPPVKKKNKQVVTDEEPSYFTLQVATFDDENDARQEMLSWHAKGEESFFLAPDDSTEYFRVFIGRFDTLSVANEKMENLEENEHIQVFITLLSADKLGES